MWFYTEKIRLQRSKTNVKSLFQMLSMPHYKMSKFVHRNFEKSQFQWVKKSSNWPKNDEKCDFTLKKRASKM